jgi:hypothetical protein
VADHILHEFVDIADPMLVVVFQLLEPVVEGYHPGLHFAHCSLGDVLECIALLYLLVLPLDHQSHLFLDAFLETSEFVDPFHHLPVHSFL